MEKKKKTVVDWVCVNPNCTKSKSDDVITAKPFVVAFFGAKVDKNRKRKVCRDCDTLAQLSLQNLKSKVRNQEMIDRDDMPVIRDAAVVLDSDSDDEGEAKAGDLDSSSESEMEVEMEGHENIHGFLDAMMAKWKIPEQIDATIQDVGKRYELYIYII